MAPIAKATSSEMMVSTMIISIRVKPWRFLRETAERNFEVFIGNQGSCSSGAIGCDDVCQSSGCVRPDFGPGAS